MMRSLALVLLLLCVNAAHAQVQWVESTAIYTNPSDSKRPGVIFVNSYTGAGPKDGLWVSVDLKPFGVTRDAKAAFLSGVLIITHGRAAQICDLSIALRAPGSDLDGGNYIGQTIETQPGGGQRSTMSTWVPLVDGVFEAQWRRSTVDQWPASCAYGINLSLQAWIR